MPTDVGIVDLMLGIPTGHEKDWYEFLKPQLREESKDYEFPVQYMFKDVPHIDPRRRPGRRHAPTDGPLRHREGDGRRRPRRPDRNRGEGDMGAVDEHPDRFIRVATTSTRTRAWTACATW